MEGIKKDIIVQSLWIGPSLSNLEKLSISSFIKNGHDFHLYAHEPVEGIPPGTTLKDGNDILSRKIFLVIPTQMRKVIGVSLFKSV